ncbi:hypothetical protein SMICM304S_03924 [Streptomyces microflavus]
MAFRARHGIFAVTPQRPLGCRLAGTAHATSPRPSAACRWIQDLDADPVAVDARLRGDPLRSQSSTPGPAGGWRVRWRGRVRRRAVMGQQGSRRGPHRRGPPGRRPRGAHGPRVGSPHLCRGLRPGPGSTRGPSPCSAPAGRRCHPGRGRRGRDACLGTDIVGTGPRRGRRAGGRPWLGEVNATRALGDAGAPASRPPSASRRAAERLGLRAGLAGSPQGSRRRPGARTPSRTLRTSSASPSTVGPPKNSPRPPSCSAATPASEAAG